MSNAYTFENRPAGTLGRGDIIKHASTIYWIAKAEKIHRTDRIHFDIVAAGDEKKRIFQLGTAVSREFPVLVGNVRSR